MNIANFGKGLFLKHMLHTREGVRTTLSMCVSMCFSVCVYVYTKKDLGLVIGDCLEISSMVCLPCY